VTAALQLAFEITWDPGLRGLLSVAVGVAVLCGSIYLIVGTNVGSRLGFLIAAAGLSGWLLLMFAFWAAYGIGYQGDMPSWQVQEVVRSEDPEDLSAAALDDARDLSRWREIPADDPARGEAQASASAAIAGDGAAIQPAPYESEADFVVIDAFERGGKSDNFFNNWFPGPHPPHYAIIQFQGVEPVEVEFGEAPPPPTADESAPVHSVIMVRDLGSRRLPAVLLTIASLIVFAVSCNALHRRDKLVTERRAQAAANA
jgi:hypothetical protein